MDKNIHKGHRERLRTNTTKQGVVNMQQHQALELLLTYVIPQKDVNPIAHALINKFGSFSNVLDAKEEELMEVKGIGQKTAHFLVTFRDFFDLYKQNRVDKKQSVKSTLQAVDIFSNYLNDKMHEEMYVMCIDSSNMVKKIELISKGTSNASSISIRKITEVVFSSNTHNVIVCHNHPDGPSKPSLADDKLTKALLMTLAINNINLLDHIILGTDDYFSYSISGKIAGYSKEIDALLHGNIIMQNKCTYNE